MLEKKKRDRYSRFLSYMLRHNPEQFQLSLDAEGYTSIKDVLLASKKEKQWQSVTEEDLFKVVEECEKQRYEIQKDMIRARYGHSKANVSYPSSIPPDILIHGTYSEAVFSIMNKGILSMGREYVHLSETDEFASLAGRRRGKLALLEVDTNKARELGVSFYYAGNEVWLSTHIPASCISEKKL